MTCLLQETRYSCPFIGKLSHIQFFQSCDKDKVNRMSNSNMEGVVSQLTLWKRRRVKNVKNSQKKCWVQKQKIPWINSTKLPIHSQVNFHYLVLLLLILLLLILL